MDRDFSPEGSRLSADATDDDVPPGAGGPVHAERGHPGRRWSMLALKILGCLVGVVILAWAVLYVTHGRFLKRPFERIATTQLQRKVEVGGDFELYFDPFNIKFLAENLSIANPDWARDDLLFHAKTIDARIATLTLLSGKRRFNWLRMVDGQANLEWSKDGRRNTWTLGDPNRKGEPLDLPRIRRALLAGTVLHYDSPPMQLRAQVRMDTVRASNTRFENDIRFSGGGTLRGDPFTLRGGLLSPNETVQGGRNQLALVARSGGTGLEVTGTLPGATEIEGADLRVVASGPDLSRLFDFLGVAIPRTRRYRILSHLTKDGDEWQFTSLRGHFGDSDIAGRLTIAKPGERLALDANLSSRVLDILDIGPFIGYDPNRLEAKGAAGAIEREGGVPHILPDAPLRTEALDNFDAKVKYTVRQVRAKNFPASNIALALTLDHRLLKLSPLSFDMSGGSLTSDIEINARQQPVKTSYDVRLSPTPMGRLLANWGVEQSGTTGVLKARAQMTGYGNSVRKSLATSTGRLAVILPRGALWTRNAELSELDIGTFVQKMFEKKLKDPVQINCGLIAFTVRDGIATADPILIDTRKNVMLGTGAFSFRDESLNLAFRADSKKFSLFSAQSPVGIGGHFVEPKLDVISGQLVTRAGAGLGLAAVASPLAGILAFVDVGDAKAADCGPVLSGARATAQRTSKGKPRDDVGNGRSGKG